MSTEERNASPWRCINCKKVRPNGGVGVEAGFVCMTCVKLLLDENISVRGFLIANFVPEQMTPSAEGRSLKEIAKHVVEHHNWHHDAENLDYVRQLEADLEAEKKRSSELEAEYIRRHRALQETLRNQFAGAMMPGVIARRDFAGGAAAEIAVNYADALIAELEKRK